VREVEIRPDLLGRGKQEEGEKKKKKRRFPLPLQGSSCVCWSCILFITRIGALHCGSVCKQLPKFTAAARYQHDRCRRRAKPTTPGEPRCAAIHKHVVLQEWNLVGKSVQLGETSTNNIYIYRERDNNNNKSISSSSSRMWKHGGTQPTAPVRLSAALPTAFGFARDQFCLPSDRIACRPVTGFYLVPVELLETVLKRSSRCDPPPPPPQPDSSCRTQVLILKRLSDTRTLNIQKQKLQPGDR